MKLLVDRDRCDSHGNCVLEAPDVFDLDDEDTVYVIEGVRFEDHTEEIERAVAVCPVAALRLQT